MIVARILLTGLEAGNSTCGAFRKQTATTFWAWNWAWDRNESANVNLCALDWLLDSNCGIQNKLARISEGNANFI